MLAEEEKAPAEEIERPMMEVKDERLEDAEAFLRRTSKDDHPNEEENKDAPASVNEGRGDSSLAGKGVGSVQRKRTRAVSSKMSDGDESDGQSESMSVGGRRKRRQAAAPVAQDAGKSRYNLRRHKANTNEITSAPAEVASQSDNPEDPAQAVAYKREQADMVDRVFVPSEAKIEENSNAVKSTDNVETVSEEVNGTSEYNNKDDHDNNHTDEHNSPLHEEEDEGNPEEEEEDDEDEEEDARRRR